MILLTTNSMHTVHCRGKFEANIISFSVYSLHPRASLWTTPQVCDGSLENCFYVDSHPCAELFHLPQRHQDVSDIQGEWTARAPYLIFSKNIKT